MHIYSFLRLVVCFFVQHGFVVLFLPLTIMVLLICGSECRCFARDSSCANKHTCCECCPRWHKIALRSRFDRFC